MRKLLLASLLAIGCSSEPAFADQVAAPAPPGPRTALAIANAKVRAPYDVQVMRENGDLMPTYALKDRFYVQGNLNERYVIRVTNPTDHRVEAVVSVDGLDVIDGDSADVRKRGYIVPAGGDVRIEGFRTSLEDVATFRFSSVDGSYAGKQGKARNVGVIAVAIFEEEADREQQQIIIGDNRPTGAPPAANGKYDYRDDLDASATRATTGASGHGRVATADKAKRERPADARRPAPTTTATAPAAPTGGYAGAAAGGAPSVAPSPPPHHFDADAEGEYGGEVAAKEAQKTNRMGLGTEFGEQRNSSATYTRFVRASNRPVAIAELRYNDAAGLQALGINVQPMPDQGELTTRETADPFPGDPHFSAPPR